MRHWGIAGLSDWRHIAIDGWPYWAD